MGTHAAIGILDPDGSVRAIYAHYDGYNGREILPEHYGTPLAAEALLEQGDLRVLPASLADVEQTQHSDPAKRFGSVGEWAKATNGYHFHYLWIGGEWRCLQPDRADPSTWCPLRTVREMIAASIHAGDLAEAREERDETRFALAQRALESYPGDAEEAMIDLVSDLRNLAALKGIDWTKVIDLAEIHYEDEAAAAPPAPDSAERSALIVQLRVIRREGDGGDANAVAGVIMDALHIGLEGAEGVGVDAPNPEDVTLVFVDDDDSDSEGDALARDMAQSDALDADRECLANDELEQSGGEG